MTISAWLLLPLALPVLLLGEFLVARLRVLSRFNIPTPVVGGLIVAVVVLGLNLAGQKVTFGDKVSAMWWTWLTTAEADWYGAPTKTVYEPFVVAFFTCVGLNASWRLARRGTWRLPLFLALSTVLALGQNVLGVTIAKAMHQSPHLGTLCGSVTLTGGHGTAMGFADTFIHAGFEHARPVGIAAATFGLVAGSLMGGPLGTLLIRRFKLAPRPEDHELTHDVEAVEAGGFLLTVRALLGRLPVLLFHLLILLVCIKVGAWISYALKKQGWIFPIYMGALIVGIVIRNTLDLFAGDEESKGKFRVETDTVDLLATCLLALFLTCAMMSLDLAGLLGMAAPMLVILVAQVVMMALFALFVTFPLMGRDYAAAIMAGGQVGFGMGSTSNAVANMKSLMQSFGPSPQAYIIVTIVGAFLIDFSNALIITYFINLYK